MSVEPFRGLVPDLTPFFDVGVTMLAVGGQSRTGFAPAIQQDVRWVHDVRRQVWDAGVSLFEKEDLTARPKQIPFPATRPPDRG